MIRSILAVGLGLSIVLGAMLGCAGTVENKPGMRVEDNRIILETKHLSYVVGKNGLNYAFRDRRTGQNHLDTTAPVPFMSFRKDGKVFGSTAVKFSRGFLFVTFGNSGVQAKVQVQVFPNYLTLELTEVNDHAINLQLANLPLTITKIISPTLTSCRNDEYAAAVIPANMETYSPGTKGRAERKPVLTAYADSRVRLEGSKIAVLGCPTETLLDIIGQVEIENGLPHPTIGGVWARKSPEQKKSYLFVDLSEATADEIIDYAKFGGFNCIVVYMAHWNCTFGTRYLVNPRYFPGGDKGLKAVSNKIHAAGLKFGMHVMNMVLYKSDPSVGPVPDPGLLKLPHLQRILAADIGPTDTFIPTTTTPTGLLSKGKRVNPWESRDLLIGDEIVTYDDIQTKRPYGFTGCKRGRYGTKASAHPTGATIDNFVEFLGDFYHADVGSDLFDRISRANAEALDKFEFDFIYPENHAISIVEPGRPRWYSCNLLLYKPYHYTKREVQWVHTPSVGANLSWHILTMGNTVDYYRKNPRDINGIMEHFNNSVRSSTNRIADLQPYEFGWFGYFTHTRPRIMEYAWSKALAYGAAMSLETKKAALDGNGRTREIFSIIKNWEELKLADYFSERIREQMKEIGREFTLERTDSGKWQVLPVTYGPEKYVAGVDGQQNIWTFQNSYLAQPLRVSIEVPLKKMLRAVRNPGLTVNNTSITFPVTLEPGWYLEYSGAGSVQVFDANGFIKANVEVEVRTEREDHHVPGKAVSEGPSPMLQKGNNSVKFFCDRSPDFGETVKVTLITKGEPLR